MHPRMRKMIIALSIVFGGLIAFNIGKKLFFQYFFAHYQPPAVTVSSATAIEKNWEPKIHAVGHLTAVRGVDVNSQAAGNVVNIHFDSGQFIEANQPLIDIDDSIDQATLKFNQADLALQEINYQRQVDLFKHKATPTATLDAAHAKLLQAQANVEKTQVLIQQKHIHSPFKGQLGLRQVNLGQYITPGKTPIVSLQSLDPLLVEFSLPEHLQSHLKIGQTVAATRPHEPHLLFMGKITALNSKIDLQTHNIKVQATFANCPMDALKDPEHSPHVTTKKNHQNNEVMVYCDSEQNAKHHISRYAFIPGMFVSIDIEQPVIPHVIVVPSTAISYSLYGNSVFIIKKDKDISTVERVFVVTGEQQGNETIILKGILPGQKIVNTGELKLQNGTRVVINNSIYLNTHEIH